MNKNDAAIIACTAHNQTLTELLTNYYRFHALFENTPDWLGLGQKIVNPENGDVQQADCKSHDWQRALHGSIGLCTESAELLDIFKKELYGKNRKADADHIREECGDVLFYLVLIMRAYNFTLRDLIKDNLVKLVNRYSEKLG